MAKTRGYASVSELVRDMAPDADFQLAFENCRKDRKIIKDLMAIRAAKELSQRDIAGKLNCTQGRVSKLENSKDDDLRLGDLRAYAEAIGCDFVAITVPRDMTPVDRVKCHVFAIKKHSDDLAKLARSDEKIAQGVAQFFIELVYNFGRLVGDSVKALPTKSDGLPFMDLQVEIDDRPRQQSDNPPPCCVDADDLKAATS
jgi:transcriptional regulator with XRE-family HTH domain